MLFISTTDPETKETLLKEGFTLVEDSSNRWIFLNSNPGKFALSAVNKEKVTETDRVCI